MISKPVIGINSELLPATKERPALSILQSGYYDSVLRAGGIPIIVPPLPTRDEIESILDRVDGFILIGGADLDPRRDGFMLHPTVRTMQARREDFDRMLVHALADRCTPTFGIGAGMQLLNVSQGGNLYLHIPADLPQALPHADCQDPAHRHSLQVVPGSLMDRVYGDGEIRVNSQHHMAIDELAEGFEATAHCPDGIIEAIESRRPDWFAIGTQFHPENCYASAIDIRIFEEFVAGIPSAARAVRMVA